MHASRRADRSTPPIVAFVLSLAVSVPALADGIAFKGRDWSSLIPAVENEQIAAIHHRDGIQRMIIAINFDAEEDEQALWMFPVPGKPEAVSVDIQDQFPRFMGRDPIGRASETISSMMTGLRAWEILPLVIEGLFLLPHLGYSGDIGIHAEVEKWGIHAEVLTTRSTDALGKYLTSKGVSIATDQLRTIAPYLDDEYTLVVAWIASPSQVREEFPDLERRPPGAERTPCLYLEFPTERAYFPLKPTSAYGDWVIPFRLYVTGFVEPETQAAAVRDQLSLGYYRQAGFQEPELRRWADGLPAQAVPYTAIYGEIKAHAFTDDLWFAPVRLPAIGYADAVQAARDRGFIFAIFAALLVGMSYVSGGITGWLVGEKWSAPAKLGCWNVLTWVGLRLALRYHNLTGGSGETEPGLRRNFSYAFLMVFVVLSIVVQVMLLLPFWLLD